MKTSIFILALMGLTLVSCNDNRKVDSPKQETPNALKEKSSSEEILSKRSYDDLVESLYNELLSKNLELKKLEDRIEELKKSKSDSTILFDKFNEKNQSYFSAAIIHIAEIKDSLLREKMKNLIANDSTQYNSAIDKHTQLMKIVEAKGLTISDLHNILKIVKTLPIIKKYQTDNLPSTKPLEGYSKQQDDIIKLADSLSKN
jgi:hypothetical protein